MHIKLEEMFNLNKKVIIITGAAGLLGREHAHAIAAFKGIPVIIDINDTSSFSESSESSKSTTVHVIVRGNSIATTDYQNYSLIITMVSQSRLQRYK